MLFYIYCAYFTWVFLIAVSTSMAVKTGRSDLLWGSIAFFISPIITIVFLYFLGETEEVKREKRWQEKIKRISDEQYEKLREDFKKQSAYFDKCYGR